MSDAGAPEENAPRQTWHRTCWCPLAHDEEAARRRRQRNGRSSLPRAPPREWRRASDWNVITFCEEPRLAYDRVNLTSFLGGKIAGRAFPRGARAATRTPASRCTSAIEPRSSIVSASAYSPPKVDASRTTCWSWRPARLPSCRRSPGATPGAASSTAPSTTSRRSAPGQRRSETGVVIGGGLLGLEAANALTRLGLETHVVEFAPRLMAMQIDEGGGEILRAQDRGARRLGPHRQEHDPDRLRGRPGDRDPLRRRRRARDRHGGLLRRHQRPRRAGPRAPASRSASAAASSSTSAAAPPTRTSSPSASARATAAASTAWSGPATRWPGPRSRPSLAATTGWAFDMSTKLKLMGVDVASFGDAHGTQPGARVVAFSDAVSGVYKKLVVSSDRQRLLGGILVGDASSYGQLLSLTQSKAALPRTARAADPPPARGGSGAARRGRAARRGDHLHLPERHQGRHLPGHPEPGADLGRRGQGGTTAGTGCGSCVPLLGELLDARAEARREGGLQPPLRALPPLAPGALPPGPGTGAPQLRRR